MKGATAVEARADGGEENREELVVEVAAEVMMRVAGREGTVHCGVGHLEGAAASARPGPDILCESEEHGDIQTPYQYPVGMNGV